MGSTCRVHGSPAATTASPPQLPTEESVDALCNALHHWHHCPELYKAIEGIRFIADHTKREEDSTKVISVFHSFIDINKKKKKKDNILIYDKTTYRERIYNSITTDNNIDIVSYSLSFLL